MKLFNDIRNYINNDSFRIIIYNDLINIINFKEILDIKSTSIKLISDKKINIIGNNLKIIKMLDNELLIKGIIKDINIYE